MDPFDKPLVFNENFSGIHSVTVNLAAYVRDAQGLDGVYDLPRALRALIAARPGQAVEVNASGVPPDRTSQSIATMILDILRDGVPPDLLSFV